MGFFRKLVSLLIFFIIFTLTAYIFLLYVPTHLIPNEYKAHLETAAAKVFPRIIKYIDSYLEDEHVYIYEPTKTISFHLLHHAALQPQEELLQMLLQVFKMDPNVVDSKGATPLHYAASRTNAYAIEILLENGANPFAVDKFNRTPEQITVLYGPDSEFDATMQNFHSIKKVHKNKDELAAAIASKREMHIVQVERRNKSDFSFRDFYENFATKSLPVVIEGGLPDMFGINPDDLKKANWDVDFIKSKCGNKTVEPMRQNLNAKTWGRLIEVEKTTVADFIDNEYRPKDPNAPPSDLYIFDWSLPRTCKEILSSFVVPKYFANDYLQRIPRNGYTGAWPSLFIGRKGTGAALHIDSGGTNFWMVEISGRKLWRFVSRENAYLLYPNWSSDTFQANIINPDYEKFPMLRLLNVSETILTPGDLLFVPAGSPHQVTNLEDIIAISMNYLDGSNVKLAKKELLAAAAEDDDESSTDGQIVEYLEKNEPVMDMEPEDMPWEKFYFKYRFNKRFKKDARRAEFHHPDRLAYKS